MKFEYFYGNETDEVLFYRVPKVFFTSPKLRELSDGAKLLYSLMLDRVGLSVKNGWFDDKGRAFIKFTIEDVTSIMNCGKGKAVKMIDELDSEKGCGLIDHIKLGQGRAAVIFVKRIISEDSDETFTYPKKKKENLISKLFSKSEYIYEENQNSNIEIHTDSVPQTEIQPVQKAECNKNNINNNYMNNNSSLSISTVTENRKGGEEEEDIKARYSKTVSDVKEQIDYDFLIATHDKKIIDNIVSVMTDVMLVNTKSYSICGIEVSAELVKMRFRELTNYAVEVFMLLFERTKRKIHTMDKYLLSSLYNISKTADIALDNMVKSDMYGGGVAYAN